MKILEENKDSIIRAFRFEFDSIQEPTRLIEIYKTTKTLGYSDEAFEMRSDLVIEGIINPY